MTRMSGLTGPRTCWSTAPSSRLCRRFTAGSTRRRGPAPSSPVRTSARQPSTPPRPTRPVHSEPRIANESSLMNYRRCPASRWRSYAFFHAMLTISVTPHPRHTLTPSTPPGRLCSIADAAYQVPGVSNRDVVLCGNFDIISDHCSRIFLVPPHPRYPPGSAALGKRTTKNEKSANETLYAVPASPRCWAPISCNP